MRKHVRCLIPTVVAGGLAIGAAYRSRRNKSTSIGVSYQPAVYWAVPYYIATEKGWWKEVGLDPNFTTFASGAPQVCGRGLEVVGRRRHRLGAGRARLATFQHPDHRHYQ